MGSHESPESCLVSPRSGTRVKLLGEDDASLDRYNLDKSGRVKAFCYGEYDECIEKAKASAASSGKKVVKYTRREDAILHALEIERNNETDVQLDLESREGCSSHRRYSSWIRNPKHISSSESEPDDFDGKETVFEAKKSKELSQSGLTFEDSISVSATQGYSLPKTMQRTPNDSEDNGSEGTQRMRGPEDLGMGVFSKDKASVQSGSEGSDEFAQQDSTSSEPKVCCSFSNGSPATVNRSKESCSNLKKRQPHEGLVHESTKRENCCVPPMKVMESTTMVSVPVFCYESVSPGRSSFQGAEDSKVAGLESTDSKMISSSAVHNKYSNCTVASCEKETQLDSYTCITGLDVGHAQSDPKGKNIPTITEFPVNGGLDGLFDVPFAGEEKHSPGDGGSSQLENQYVMRRNSYRGSSVSGVSNIQGDNIGTTCLSFVIEKGTILASDSRMTILDNSNSKIRHVSHLDREKLRKISDNVYFVAAGDVINIDGLWSSVEEATISTKEDISWMKDITQAANFLHEKCTAIASNNFVISVLVGGYNKTLKRYEVHYIQRYAREQKDKSISRGDTCEMVNEDYSIAAIGSGKKVAKDFLLSKVKSDLSISEAIDVAVEAIFQASLADICSGGAIRVVHLSENNSMSIKYGPWDICEKYLHLFENKCIFVVVANPHNVSHKTIGDCFHPVAEVNTFLVERYWTVFRVLFYDNEAYLAALARGKALKYLKVANSKPIAAFPEFNWGIIHDQTKFYMLEYNLLNISVLRESGFV